MKKTNIKKLSMEALKELSREKGKNGCATQDALAAQRRLFILSYGMWGAYGWDAYGSAHEMCSRPSGRRLKPQDYDESYD